MYDNDWGMNMSVEIIAVEISPHKHSIVRDSEGDIKGRRQGGKEGRH